VLRALRVLRNEGLLEFRPERGAVIARTRKLVDFARLQGYRLEDIPDTHERVSGVEQVRVAELELVSEHVRVRVRGHGEVALTDRARRSAPTAHPTGEGG
jgi:hypothetical protein